MTDQQGNLIGQQLGNYRVISLLGQGGFADVYLGEHVHLHTQAAIKVLRTRLTNEDKEKFLAEAQTIARLEHPNIVQVRDFGVENGTPFLVMSHAANGSLRQLHAKGMRLSPAAIVPYVKQVASALQYAHSQRLVHRDIKPENMLLGKKNEVLLSDFGIALVAQSSRYPDAQDVAGTVAYMAPEQLQGRPVPASDQYALAIVVYEWLCGERPFQGSYMEILSQHMTATPAPLQGRNSAVLPDLEQAVMIALAKNPQERFGSVEAFANAFSYAVAEVDGPTVRKAPNLPMSSRAPLPPLMPPMNTSGRTLFDTNQPMTQQTPSWPQQAMPPVQTPPSPNWGNPPGNQVWSAGTNTPPGQTFPPASIPSGVYGGTPSGQPVPTPSGVYGGGMPSEPAMPPQPAKPKSSGLGAFIKVLSIVLVVLLLIGASVLGFSLPQCKYHRFSFPYYQYKRRGWTSFVSPDRNPGSEYSRPDANEYACLFACRHCPNRGHSRKRDDY